MFEQTFKNIDDILHKDAGCSSELDYVEQTSWILFLKYLDDLEKDRETAAELQMQEYTYILDKEYQWSTWAAPKFGAQSTPEFGARLQVAPRISFLRFICKKPKHTRRSPFTFARTDTCQNAPTRHRKRSSDENH